MQLVQRGDPRAFELLYDRHGGAAYSLAYRIVGRQATAEDVVQEALLSIWRSRLRYDQTRGSVRTWILGIVHNRAIDGLRRSSVHDRRRATLEGVEERFEAPERTEVEVARREEARTVRGALDTLPDEQRRTIELAYFGGFSHSQIAEMLDEPVGTVKGRMRLGLEKMRRQLAEGCGGGLVCTTAITPRRRRRLPAGRAGRRSSARPSSAPGELPGLPGRGRAAASGGRRAAPLGRAGGAAARPQELADGVVEREARERGGAAERRASGFGSRLPPAARSVALVSACSRRRIAQLGTAARQAHPGRQGRPGPMPRAGGRLEVEGDGATRRPARHAGLGGGRVYQAWVQHGDRMVPAPTFEVGRAGGAGEVRCRRRRGRRRRLRHTRAARRRAGAERSSRLCSVAAASYCPPPDGGLLPAPEPRDRRAAARTAGGRSARTA